jgi:hypothetical protein
MGYTACTITDGTDNTATTYVVTGSTCATGYYKSSAAFICSACSSSSAITANNA